MMNITFYQYRSLLQMQNGQPEIPTHRPVEVPDQNIPPEIQPQQRPQEAPHLQKRPKYSRRKRRRRFPNLLSSR